MSEEIQLTETVEVNYDTACSLELTDKQVGILNEEAPTQHIYIKPDGNIYLPQVFYRKILNKCFGYGRWAFF